MTTKNDAVNVAQHPWDRQADEPSDAYRGFTFYRDLTPELRSIEVAWARWDTSGSPVANDGRENRRKKTKRTFYRWSSRFRWVDRAAKYDDHTELIERAAREQARIKLAVARQQLEIDRFEFWKRHTERLQQEYEKAAKMPRMEVRQVERNDDGVITKEAHAKGVPLRELRQITEAMLAADCAAIHGHIRITKTQRIAEEKPADSIEEVSDGIWHLQSYPDDLAR